MNLTGSELGSGHQEFLAPQAFAAVLLQVLVSLRAELFLFCAAGVAYILLFSNRVPKKASRSSASKKAKLAEEESRDVSFSESAVPSNVVEAQAALQNAFEAGDHRKVQRCWSFLKGSTSNLETVSLASLVESMQRLGKEHPMILREVKLFLEKSAPETAMRSANELLESLGKRMDTPLMTRVRELLPSVAVVPNQRTYEIFVTAHFATRNFADVKQVMIEMEAAGVQPSVSIAVVAMKVALKQNSWEDAMQHFGRLKGSLKQANATCSTAPRHIITQLVELACKESKLSELIEHLYGISLGEEVFNVMLCECIRRRDGSLTGDVEKLAQDQGISFSEATYALLLRCRTGDPTRIQQIFEEVVSKGQEVTPDFAFSLLACCSQTHNSKLADRLLEYMKPKQVPVLSAFVRFYVEVEQLEKACDVYEQEILPQCSSSALLDARLQRTVMNAALRCGRSNLAKIFLESSPSDIAKHITMIRSYASAGNLTGAIEVFRSLQQSGAELNSIVYNTVIDACVECRDLETAEEWMKVTKEAGVADVVSYNTMIKAHLHQGNFSKARALMRQMQDEGLQPNRVTFNELINAMVVKGRSYEVAEIWNIVQEMRAAGVAPNQVTCSILLKNLQATSGNKEIRETLSLIKAIEEPMDEVLLSSVVEACVRIGKPEILADMLKQLRNSQSISITGSHTFGSLIKAYGRMQDMENVWRCWNEMRGRRISPSSITLGCMVEAVVSNSDTEAAYKLVKELREDEQCRGALNAVIYCSILKGFAREKKIDRAFAVHEEMCDRNIEMSSVSFNSLINACARCGRMDCVPQLLADMERHGIQPNVITYSTVLKGHCQMGDVKAAFAILKDMREKTNMKPDEIMYNSLLDGCAQSNMVEDGMRLLQQMLDEGVPPSSFTLSVLIKLMSRARKLDEAFRLVDELSRKHKLTLNVHVYTNLIHACVTNQALPRGLELLDEMVERWVQPENRTYACLIRGSLSQGQCVQAEKLLRAALGLNGAPEKLANRCAQVYNFDRALLNETLLDLVDRGFAQELAAPLIADIHQMKPHIHVDPATQRRVMSGMARRGSPQEWTAQSGKTGRSGKGYGKGADRFRQ
eukprot:CAMPEP_0170608328 /NCGR_PEP_ID=MMETSP0224-20130122/21527_1 /TAXON_ID=285029 /ORGANISM="Togula jolla, Strain CCCM 725" /LENGTH=1097 /DNA_ID=CAMNT_0010933549 /DNA_START=67 /DNA_END=3357 /DNA_ORIENTATION=+